MRRQAHWFLDVESEVKEIESATQEAYNMWIPMLNPKTEIVVVGNPPNNMTT